MKLSGIRNKVFLDRYSLKDKSGKPTEKDPAQMWKRVARGIAQVEKPSKKIKWEKQFFHAMKGFKYVPGGRILAGAGTGYQVTYYNCFVIPSPKDSRDGILDTLKHMVEIMAHGGGVGINLSSLRPRGARVKKVNGFSSGPINWAELFSVATKDIIQQGGTRRGALMLMLWDWHPDIEEFINVKTDLSRITGANLSVCVSDDFMEAVRKDDDWNLVFPDLDEPDYDRQWEGYLHKWKKRKKKIQVYKKIKARKLWNMIAESAWKSAEPGVVFMERYNKLNNNWYWNYINCVNPCVTGDTLVATTSGIQSMLSLYKQNKPFTVVVDGKPYLSTHVKKTGIKKVYKLKTKEGYELRLTGDHKVFTAKGKIQAKDLVKGDNIQLATGASFGTKGTYEEGSVLGWLVGDGAMKKDVATLFFYKEEKKELAPYFAQMVAKMVDGEQIVTRSYPIGPQYIPQEDKAVIESVRLWRIARRFGITPENKYVVPEDVFIGSESMQRGFLQGIFSSDGYVSGTPEKGVSVRLTSVSEDLLISVQRLLLNFGIVSKIYKNRRDAGKRLLPDGKGGNKLYHCRAYHDLVISKSAISQFGAVIGFLQKEKQEKLRLLLSSYHRGPYKQHFVATFDHLEEDGIEDVFDITVADIHRFSANGLMVSNCGEEGLPDWGVCNLGSLNLSVFVKGEYDPEKPGEMDYKALAEHTKIAVRFQDNVVESDAYIFEGIKEVQYNGERRIGLGTMGLGDALIKMHLRYGSQESLKVIEKIYKTIRDAAYEASIQLASEKKPFPKFKGSKYLKGKFIKSLPKSIKSDIKKHGIRNSILLMQAPTGSTSLMSGTTSGIEPVYEFEFIRRDRLGEHILRHPLYDKWFEYFKQKNGSEPDKSDRPNYFVSANDLTPEDHVRVQAMVQLFVDASISKTVNAPSTHTVEDVKKLYTLAYELGCKGVAYMREGSRRGVLERKDKAVKVEGVNVPQVKPRPMRVEGSTYQIGTPVGRAYITVNENGAKEPLEVFINVGKAGSDVSAMAEGIGRLVSLVLRIASPLSAMERAKEVVRELSGIGGSRHMGFGQKRVRSLPDAISKVLATHFDFKLKNGNGQLVKRVNGESKSESSKDLHDESEEDSTAYQHLQMAEYDFCPECGVVALAYEEGCKKCYSCGYSEC